jgi:ECF sigma factor
MIALDDALNAQAKIDARRARVMELRFFGGLSVEETSVPRLIRIVGQGYWQPSIAPKAPDMARKKAGSS